MQRPAELPFACLAIRRFGLLIKALALLLQNDCVDLWIAFLDALQVEVDQRNAGQHSAPDQAGHFFERQLVRFKHA